MWSHFSCGHRHHTLIWHKYHIKNTPKQHELDRLHSKFKGAADEALNCAVPVHATQMNACWRGVGKVSSASAVRC